MIDPTLVYSTYLGGSDQDQSLAVAVDASGNAYLTGFTGSSNFPITPDAFQTVHSAPISSDVFVSKLNASGSALIYSTYLGGGEGYGIAVDAEDSAYVTGFTNSSDFPTTPSAFQTTFVGAFGGFDPFVTKLNHDGSALLYSTYLGEGGAAGIAVDSSGSAYITGTTLSPDFPTTPGAFQTVPGTSGLGRVQDGFVSKLNAAGSALAYSTFLGSTDTGGNGIAVDASGNAYVVGITNASEFPTTPGAFQKTPRGGFVVKLNEAGSALIYSTFIGGNGYNSAYAIALDKDGNAYITGLTSSPDFLTTPGAFQRTCQGCVPDKVIGDAFITKLNAAGSALVYSTYLGAGQTLGLGIAVDADGNAYVSGNTNSYRFPRTREAFQTVYGGGITDAFLTKLKADGSALLYSSYLGGNDIDNSTGIAVDALGRAYIVGYTFSSNFPVTSGGFQTTFGGAEDGFISRFDLIGPPTDKDQCKDEGWEVFTIPRKFTNQGECVSYVETGK